MPLRVSRHELAGGLAGHVFGKMQSSDQKLMTACYSDWQICQSRTYSSTTTMRRIEIIANSARLFAEQAWAGEVCHW
jgi:hypothetical protein